MKRNEVQNFINAVRNTDIDIRVENGNIKRNFAQGTAGSIAFLFTDIYAKLMIGIFGKTSETDTITAMNKIQESAAKRVKEYFSKKGAD